MKRLMVILGLSLVLISSCTVPVEKNDAASPVFTTGDGDQHMLDTPNPPVVQPSNAVTHYPATPTYTQTATVTSSPTPLPGFSFVVTSDMSYYGGKEYIDYPNFFAGLLGYVKQFDPGAFMISPGDVLPAEETYWTIQQVLGEDYLWFPIPGNHDFGYADYSFLKNFNYDPNGNLEPNIVNWGPPTCPETTYSFDYLNAHFVGVNVYCNDESAWGIDGSITDTLYDWLADDLAQTDKEHIFVFGHEPAYPQPDDKTGYVNHSYESLDEYPEARDRFWALLQSYNVVAYINGHTHGYSAEKIGGVWQLDAGQAMGVRAAPSPGTFLIINVEGDKVTLETYRGEEGPGFSFLLWEEVVLNP
jgi:hypothetical protein